MKTVSSQASASYISLLFFSWLDPLVWTGWKRPLRQQDLPVVSPEVAIVLITMKKMNNCDESNSGVNVVSDVVNFLQGGSGGEHASVSVAGDSAAGGSWLSLSLATSHRLLWIGLFSGLLKDLNFLKYFSSLKTKYISSSQRCSCQEGSNVQGLGLFFIRVLLVFCSPLLLQQIIRNVEHLEVFAS